jgi:hypothetical protein
LTRKQGAEATGEIMGRWQDLIRMLADRRVGFRVDESMSGSHRFVRDFPPGKVAAGTELPLSFQATWGHPHLSQFLNPRGGDFLFALLDGTVTAGGITGEAPIKGTLELRYFQDALIRYTFEFEALDRQFRFVGEKRDLRPWNLHRTHTTCHGTLTDLTTDEVISEAVVRFDLWRLHRLLLSLRPG